MGGNVCNLNLQVTRAGPSHDVGSTRGFSRSMTVDLVWVVS